MRRRIYRVAVIATGISAAVFLALGIVQLFALRFKTGDVYPPYSSLRADPLGTKVIYEALREIDGMDVSRSYESAQTYNFDEDSTVLYLGDTFENGEEIPVDIVLKLNSFIARGGRVVITIQPRNVKQDEEEEVESGTNTTATVETIDEDTLEAEEAEKKWIGVCEWMGIHVKDAAFTNAIWAVLSTDYNGGAMALPQKLSCHTSAYFENAHGEDGEQESITSEKAAMMLGGEWQSVFVRDQRPVIIEKKFGLGTVVLSAMSYFVSNEAMRNERYPGLIGWLTGGKAKVVFDEYHHSIAPQQGLWSLMMKYRLGWFIGGVVLLALLFVWQNAVSIVPPLASAGPAGRMLGKDSVSGLINLLRRNIPVSTVLETCFVEWKKTLRPFDSNTEEKIESMKDLMQQETKKPIGKRDFVGAYNKMVAKWKEKRRHHER